MPFSGLKVEGIKIIPIPYALTRRNLHTKGIKRAALQGNQGTATTTRQSIIRGIENLRKYYAKNGWQL